MTPKLVKKRDFRLTNAPGVTAQATAEHCLSMMFALARQMPIQLRQQEQRLWKHAPRHSFLAGYMIAMIDLDLGVIGRAPAERRYSVGTRVIAARRSHEALEYVVELYRLHKLHSTLREVRHVALTNHIYNPSRGSLIDEDALEAAVKDGRLAGVGLDSLFEELFLRQAVYEILKTCLLMAAASKIDALSIWSLKTSGNTARVANDESCDL
jgi:phosphoglycerate dehydrogenase-like enzyme